MTKLNEITGANFDSDVLAREGVSVVRFWATWCAPCTRMKPVYNEVAAELADQALFGEVDIDAAPEVAGSLGIRSVPTVVIFKDGKPVDGIVGMAPKSQLLERIRASM